ncbi:MAG: KH domain-containing protein [Candidatus Eisenbacteria bacterium]|nr:KH domain-containing protein [Candidatus Eisenbacteria bacterium]
MQELVEYVARGLVTRPDDVNVTQSQKGEMIVYEVRVADEDKGRVIGKNGRTAKAMRAIIGAAATKAEKKATVEIID